ncbi:MAG: hypothetical protein R3C10_00270 [Pirellulales bacterium]
MNLYDGGVFAGPDTGGILTYVRNGGTLNIYGGIVDTNQGLRAGDGALLGGTVNIYGGAISDGFGSLEYGRVNIFGTGFKLNGSLIAGLENPGDVSSLNVPRNSLLTGTLSDGTPFLFDLFGADFFTDDTLTLHSVEVVPVGPSRIIASVDAVPNGIRYGQTLTVDNGGAVRSNFTAGPGSSTIVQGGAVGKNFEADSATVEIYNGMVGNHFDAYSGSVIHIAGGSLGPLWEVFQDSEMTISGGSVGEMGRAHEGARVNVSGGVLGPYFIAMAASEVRVTGGTLDPGFTAMQGSTVDISGGAIGYGFTAKTGSSVDIRGGEFRVDGVPVPGLANIGDTVPFNLPNGALFTGVLEDGTPFSITTQDVNHSSSGDAISDGTVKLHLTELPPVGPSLIVAPTDFIPLGIRGGQTLVVNNGAVVGDHFNAAEGSTVRIEQGGALGEDIEVVSAHIEVSGGSLGRFLNLFAGSTLTMTDGFIGSGLHALHGSTMTFSGGTAESIRAQYDCTVNVSGDAILDELLVLSMVPLFMHREARLDADVSSRIIPI